MVVLHQEKVKIKSTSNSENLYKAPKYGIFDSLLEHYHEISSVLIEPTQSINIGTTETMKTLYIVTSMTEEEKPSFNIFFEESKIKFSWSYADMPGMDLNIIMHHLSLLPGVKPVKQNLRKMHLHIALLVKVELKKLMYVGFI